MTEFFIDSCFLLLPHWTSKFTSTLLGLIGYPHRKIPCKSSVNLKLCSIFLQPSPERRIPARSTCSNLSDWFFTDTLQQTTAQQPDFQLHKLVNSSHNKPANVIWGNIDQPNAHPSSVNLQLGRHMLLWQYQLPTNKACSRKIFFFPSLFFPLISRCCSSVSISVSDSWGSAESEVECTQAWHKHNKGPVSLERSERPRWWRLVQVKFDARLM